MSIDSSGDRSIIYLACTFNIYPNRSWFETYKVVSDTILFEDNKGLSIIGMNTIWIKMYDKSVRTLDIRHASEMKKNLISLSLFLFLKLWLFN